MRLKYAFVAVALIFLGGTAAYAQSGEPGPIRSSPAYAEVLLQKTELQADLEAMLIRYTEENPKVIDARNEIAALNKSIERIFNVKPTETGKLTLALGRLIVKQAALHADLARLLRSSTNEQADVKRLKRKIEIYESAINEILK